MCRAHVPTGCTERTSGPVIGNPHRGQGLPDSRPRAQAPIKQGFPLWLDAFGGALWRRFGWTPTHRQKRGPHRLALRATTPFETPVLPLIFASLQLGGNLASNGVVASIASTVWRALPPPEKVVRWGSLAALGLAFFRRRPREHSCWTHFTRTTPKTCRAHFVSLPAGAFGVAKECHPSAPSRWPEIVCVVIVPVILCVKWLQANAHAM